MKFFILLTFTVFLFISSKTQNTEVQYTTNGKLKSAVSRILPSN